MRGILRWEQSGVFDYDGSVGISKYRFDDVEDEYSFIKYPYNRLTILSSILYKITHHNNISINYLQNIELVQRRS